MPISILAFNKVDLPGPVPVFQLLLTLDGQSHRSELFKSDQPVRVSALRKTFCRPGLMLPEPARKIGSNADVNIAATPAGQNVHAGLKVPHGQVGMLSRNKFGMTRVDVDFAHFFRPKSTDTTLEPSSVVTAISSLPASSCSISSSDASTWNWSAKSTDGSTKAVIAE